MSIKVLTSRRFRKSLQKLSAKERVEVERAIDKLSSGFGLPHRHQGLGIRKLIGPLFELRAGLDLRVLFWLERGELVLHFVGNHDEVRAFLKKQT